jgi:hypothetical protein
VAGGEKFNKLFFAVVNWVHDLYAAIMKEGGGEEEMGMDVRVMWGRKYVDEDGCVCCFSAVGYSDGMDEHVRV